MKKIWHKAWIFDKKMFSRLFGLPLAGLATAFSVVVYPTHAFEYNLAQTEIISPVVVTTRSEYQFPLETTLGISQNYHSLHKGVDLRSPRGTAVLAMDSGVVIEVEKIKVGYGHYVRIAHSGTMSSLYAHLDKVNVKPGDKVERGANIGSVGMTGRTSGPHLHFEIYDGNKAVNPMSFI